MKKQYLWLIVIAGLVAFGAGCKKKTADNANDNSIINQEFDLNEALDLNVGVDDSNTNESIDSNENTNDDADENDNENLNTNTSNNANANKNKNTNTTAAGTTSSSGVVKITGPETDAELTSPFYVEGTASTGDSVYVRLKASGSTIFTEKISVKNRAFRGKLLFNFSRTKSGTIEVFQKDSSDAEINLASVDVLFNIESSSDSNDNENRNENTNSSADANVNANSNTSY